MVFTTTDGGLANRQAVTKEIARAANATGLATRPASQPTAVDAPWSPLCMRTAVSTSPMLLATSVTLIHRQLPAMSAASATARPTRPALRPRCSILRSTESLAVGPQAATSMRAMKAVR